MIGKEISHFRITEKLGEGGMGVVYKARDLKLDRFVALKLLAPSQGDDPAELERFQHEARAISALNHHHVATIHALEEHEGRKVIVLEYLSGGTLRKVLRQGQLPIERVLEYAIQIADGLAHVHREGIIHRDLKTDNIMLTKDGELKITDFGLAKLQGLTKVTRTGKQMGTAAYMSPEQARGETIDSRSDIFSFGVLLYELTTGMLPFRGEHEAALLYEIVYENPRPMNEMRDDAPAGLEEIISKAMEKTIAARYQSVDEMHRNLKDLRDGNYRPVPPKEGMGRPRLFRLTPASIFMTSLPIIAVILVLWFALKESESISVAVLPFRLLAGDSKDTAWVGYGMSQNLTSNLSKIRGLRVLPWETSQRYREIESVPDLGIELGVERLVVGSFRITENKINTSIELIDPHENRQVWADEFDGTVADIFILQTNIARDVAAGIIGELGTAEEGSISGQAATNTEAYKFYIMGSQELQSDAREGTDMALAYFERAIELDRELADAYVGRGAALENRFFRAWGGGIEGLEMAEKSYRRALEIDPGSISAKRGLVVSYWERGMFEECLKLGASVADHEPDDIAALMLRADAYQLGGLPDKAVPIFERVLQLDKADQGAAWGLVISLAWSLQPDRAIDVGQQSFENFGEDPELHVWVGIAYLLLGDLDAAKVHLHRADELFGEETREYVAPYLWLVNRQSGDSVLALRTIEPTVEQMEQKLRSDPTNFRLTHFLAELHALMGNHDRAIELLKVSSTHSTSGNGLAPVLLLLSEKDTSGFIANRWEEIVAGGTDELFAITLLDAIGYFGKKNTVAGTNQERMMMKMRDLNLRRRRTY
ncbi:MAG TPA: protein kinase [Bacteroidota bacterium]|nr:protein kinase [Bacteroidota bacterium]